MSSYLCRLCFETHIKKNNYSNYFQTIGCLMDVFPGMNFNLTSTIQLCDTCFSNLQSTVKLKQTFLECKTTFLNRRATVSNRYCTVCFRSENDCSFMMFNDNSMIVLKGMIQIVLSVNTDDHNPNVCTVCWPQLKAIHKFKIHCFRMEKCFKAHCIKKQLSKLTENDLQTFVHQIPAISHEECYEKYGHVYPNLDYDMLLQKTVIIQHKNVQESHNYTEDIREHNGKSVSLGLKKYIKYFADEKCSGGDIIAIDDDSDDCMIVIDNTDSNSTISIEDEETPSVIEENNENFDLNEIVEYNNNVTIVIEDEDAKIAINNDYPTIIIEDEESDSIEHNNNNSNSKPNQFIMFYDDCYEDKTSETIDSQSVDCYESFNQDKTSENIDGQSVDEDVLVFDQDIYEIGTKLTTEHIFANTKHETQVAQLHTNAVRPSTNLQIWGCYVCPQVFIEKCKMRKHLMDHEIFENKNGRFKCKLCPYCCKFSRSLTRHNWIHSRKFHVRFSGLDAKYFCQYCDQIFNKQVDIGSHMSQHLISSKKFWCTHCHISTGSSEKLRAHYRKLHGQKKQRLL